ncbi:ROK family protein, partial [Streptomyces hyaluromycini]
VASFERAAQALAAGIAATATLVEIDIAVIGGGVGKAGDILFTPLRKALTDYATLSFVQRLTVVPAQMGTDAGLVGAAAAALAAWPDAEAAGVSGASGV